jgi:2'-5' RNA ligase
VSFDTQSLDRIRLKKSVLSPKGPAYTTIEEVPLRG